MRYSHALTAHDFPKKADRIKATLDEVVRGGFQVRDTDIHIVKFLPHILEAFNNMAEIVSETFQRMNTLKRMIIELRNRQFSVVDHERIATPVAKNITRNIQPSSQPSQQSQNKQNYLRPSPSQCNLR